VGSNNFKIVLMQFILTVEIPILTRILTVSKTQQSFTNVYKRQQMFIKAIATNRLNIFVELTAVRTALFTNYKTEPL
jgi:hypothetical protein